MECNRKYDKFREDIKNNLEICTKNNIELRYILEYRVFTYELLYKVSQILMDFGINTIYPSTGYLLDDINDNILASALINKKVPINIICNGNIWNISQINNVSKNFKLDYDNINEKTGYDAAKFLVDFYYEVNDDRLSMERSEKKKMDFKFPLVYTHSANPIGSANIMGYVNNFLMNEGQPQNCVRVNVPHT